MRWKSLSRVRLFATPGLYSPWDSPGQNSGVGSLSLLQGIFPIQDRAQVSHIAGGFFISWATREADYRVHGILQARVLEQIVFPFSRGSSQARDQTQVSHTAGGFFISWAIREAQLITKEKGIVILLVMRVINGTTALESFGCFFFLIQIPGPHSRDHESQVWRESRILF